LPFQPIVNEATGQLDASIYYQLNPNWKVGLQGVNLLQETIKTSAVINDEGLRVPRSWFINDTRYVFSLKGKF